MSVKVMVGMSGGVDSSVAAKLLLDEGYDVTGVTLKLFDGEEDPEETTRTCCSLSDVEDARSVAYKLGFEHFVFNFKDRFREDVMQKFIESYLAGETPNPCIECNRHIKFDKMLRRAQELGYDCIATGHYAVRELDEKIGKYILKRPLDRSKDQTYVLYGITQYQLSKTLFPLGGYDKHTVRKIAEDAGLVNSRKPDSQDICFVPDGDYGGFISRNTGAEIKPGDFLDSSGNVIGKHKGVIHYTIGQRRGLGIALGKPAYVTDKNAENNTVTIGTEQELYRGSITVKDLNFISGEYPQMPVEVTVKTRYSQSEQPAKLTSLDDGRILVCFHIPQRAPAKGQAAVFYDGDIVLGGGTIE